MDRGRKGFFFLASPEEKGGGALGCRMLSLFVSRRQPDATILNLRSTKDTCMEDGWLHKMRSLGSQQALSFSADARPKPKGVKKRAKSKIGTRKQAFSTNARG